MNYFSTIGNELRDLWSNRHEPEYLHTLVEWYWRALLTMLALVMFGAIYYGGSTLYAALGLAGDETTFSQGGGGIMLNKEELQRTIDAFAARAEKYEAFKKTLPSIPDPSR